MRQVRGLDDPSLKILFYYILCWLSILVLLGFVIVYSLYTLTVSNAILLGMDNIAPAYIRHNQEIQQALKGGVP